MFVSPAFAQDAAGGFGGIQPLIPLILIFVVFYFLLIRPQQKKAKAHREMIGNLRRGDRIVTTGGLIGQIQRVVGENELLVEIADGVRVRVMRGMIAELLSKPEPGRAPAGDGGDDDEEPGETQAKGRRRRRRETSAPAAEPEPQSEPEAAEKDDETGEEPPRTASGGTAGGASRS